MGFKTQSEINEILPEKKRVTIKTQEEEAEEQKAIEDENLQAGDVPQKEYDYLLSMPIFNLTEEKVEELQKLLKDKRAEYDRLLEMHIFEIWNNDLDAFLEALQKHEDQEERDRLAHKGGTAGGGRKGAKRAPAKKAIKDENSDRKKPV